MDALPEDKSGAGAYRRGSKIIIHAQVRTESVRQFSEPVFAFEASELEKITEAIRAALRASRHGRYCQQSWDEAGKPLFTAAGDHRGEQAALIVLGLVALARGEYDRARLEFERSLELADFVRGVSVWCVLICSGGAQGALR